MVEQQFRKQQYTVQDLAGILGVSRETARIMADREPDIIRVKGRGCGNRIHRRIPHDVVARIQRRMKDRCE